MVQKLDRDAIALQAIVHDAPPAARRNAPLDRSFELPSALYATMVALFLGYIALMAVGFASPQMILPVAIFVLFIVAFFGVPALWVRLQPDTPVRAMTMARFRATGIQTGTGHCDARAASVQVLILPVLLMAWGVAAVTIAAVVG
ncbi:MAG: hypothetical protein H5U21_05050 [Porphyrobacter sp.]|nr:hypothetical protein [Porphyrobacter sp.]